MVCCFGRHCAGPCLHPRVALLKSMSWLLPLLLLLLLRTSALQDFVQLRLIQQLRVTGLHILLRVHMALRGSRQRAGCLMYVRGMCVLIGLH